VLDLLTNESTCNAYSWRMAEKLLLLMKHIFAKRCYSPYFKCR